MDAPRAGIDHFVERPIEPTTWRSAIRAGRYARYRAYCRRVPWRLLPGWY